MPAKPVVAIALLLAALAIVAFFAWPEYQQFRRVSRQLDAARTELAFLDEYYSDLERLAEELNQYEDTMSKLKTALPERPGIPAFLNYLQTASSRSGLLFEKFSSPKVDEFKAVSGLKKISTELSLQGTYSGLKAFLSELYRSARLVEVDSVSFSTPTEEGVFTFSIKVRAHSY